MSAYAKLTTAAAAALVVVAVVGCGSTSAPSATASAIAPAPSSPSPSGGAPSASPSAPAAYPAWYTGERAGAGILPAGSQTTRRFLAGSTFTVPDGWVNAGDQNEFYYLFPDSPANAAEYAGVGDTVEGVLIAPLARPYFTCDAWEDNRGTASEMAAALETNKALATSGSTDVRIGGLRGHQLDIQVDPGRTETCPGDPPTYDLRDQRVRTLLLDTPDHRVLVVFLSSLHSAGHEAFLAEAMPIVESFQFEMTP